MAVVVLVASGCPDEPLTPAGCATECPAGLVCDEATGTCVPSSADAGAQGCAQDADCVAPTARCAVETHVCVQCIAGTDCGSGGCADGVCLPFPDRCEVAQKLVLSATPSVVVSTTQQQGDDVRLACAAGEGAPDLVYELVVAQPSRIHVTVAPTEGSALRPVAGLLSDCAKEKAPLACVWADDEDATAHLSVDVPAGHTFLWVDADYGTAGAFRLEATAVPSAGGDSCASPLPIAFEDDHFSTDGHTDTLTDDYNAFCGTSGGFGSPDAVYALTLDAPKRVQVKATSKTDGFRPLVYLRRPDACAKNATVTAEVDCGQSLPKVGANFDVPLLAAGTYWLIVDGDVSAASELGSAGDYHLEVNLLPPLALAPNDRCVGATVLQLPETGTTQVTANTFSAFDDATSACGGSGPDVVYAFTLTAPRYLEARVTPDGSSAFVPTLYLRSECGSDDPYDLAACSAATSSGGAAVLARGALPAGTWYLWVDGDFETRGAFTLELTTAAPVSAPANDSCDEPELLNVNLGTVTVSGSTLGASNDNTACQIPYGSPTPDVVYKLDVQTQRSLALDVQAAQGFSFRPLVYLDEGACGDPNPDRHFCIWGDPGTPGRAVHTVGSLAPGTYYLWVDGDFTSSGAFTLKATLGPPVAAPANDGCGTALALPPGGATYVGDTRSANDSTRGTCEAWEAGSGEGAGDVVYTFTTTATHDVTLKVTPDPTDGTLYRPVLYVRGDGGGVCGDEDQAVQVGCAVASKLGGTATLTLTALPAGTWSVWVDGAGQTTGKFSFSLSVQ